MPSQFISIIVVAAASVKVTGAVKPALAYPAALHKTVTATVVVGVSVDTTSPVVELDDPGSEVVEELVWFVGAVELEVELDVALPLVSSLEEESLLALLIELPLAELLGAEVALALADADADGAAALLDAEALADADAVLALLLATVPLPPPPTVPFPPVLFVERNRKNATSSSS